MPTRPRSNLRRSALDVTGDRRAFVGRGCPAGSIDDTNPDDPYLASPAGKIALIDRGALLGQPEGRPCRRRRAPPACCSASWRGRCDHIRVWWRRYFRALAGDPAKPVDSIKANIAAPVNVSISPAAGIALVGGMVGSSARGPSYSYNAIKPDIGAPGASVSAVVGTGTGEEAFGGTSGATPMVSGSAAILLQAYPHRSPAQIKALLMNTADTNILTNPGHAAWRAGTDHADRWWRGAC